MPNVAAEVLNETAQKAQEPVQFELASLQALQEMAGNHAELQIQLLGLWAFAVAEAVKSATETPTDK